MRDHNWHRGGYRTLSFGQTLEYSSNIGVSRIIDEHYNKNPERFVEGLRRIGIASDLHLPLVGSAAPRIRMPKKNARGQYTNWSKTALAWMSIGYETQVPPISTLTFYNAIANDGRMMRPRFVKRIVKDGVTIMETKPEVIREHIAKPQAVKTMQTILTHVVSQGLGRKAGSPSFAVAGKTGTAQVSKGKQGYKSGIVDYWLSFCGYFPADAPRYTCIVCIRKSGLPASGGGMSGLVFHHISEGVMAHNLKLRVEDARDTTSVLIPDVKNGNIAAADYVLNQLGVQAQGGWSGANQGSTPVWGKANRDNTGIKFNKVKTDEEVIPDLTGMGASDAVFLLEDMGIKVKLHGRGYVKRQSIAYGKAVNPGMTCELFLE
jgi:cell division protein FtsI (penicillin-binding protein 3)